MRPSSAIPTHYYAIFAIYEPLLVLVGFLGALADPKSTHDFQAPWPNGQPPDTLPLATRITIIQLGHVCALLGLLNFSLLSTARDHLSSNPALQEKFVAALLTPLLIGDFLHIYITLWGLGEHRWDLRNWSPMLICTIVLGLTLLVPRVCWHVGIGRYKDARDGNPKGIANK
ncbi:hypothetical protein C8J57DRAFT_739295 [Mycena rebaudengoi]|nr:hypothetical protein C8J57DRAFT_739295 [Mycena rebaudengoi]